MNKKILFPVIIMFVLMLISAVTLGLLSSQVMVSNTGILATANIRVYTTSACTANLTSIAWGSVRAGSSYTKTGYIRNNGSLNMTLGLSTSNWNPGALGSIIVVSWNYVADQKLTPNQILAVTWTLTIPSSVTGYSGFSFDMLVTGTEA